MRYYKNLSIDETNCTVEKEGHPIHLTAMGDQRFVTLFDHSERVLLPESSAVIRLAYHNADSDTDGRWTYREITEEAGLGAK